MEKTITEEEIRGLEEEIDSAVDRLFVERKGGERLQAASSAPPIERMAEVPVSQPIPLASLSEPEMAADQTFDFDLERALEAPLERGFEKPLEKPFEKPPEMVLETPAEKAIPSLLSQPTWKSIEKVESQLLSLEWEITETNLKRTKEAILSLRDTIEDDLNILSILDRMEAVLSEMLENEERIHPSLIKVLLDSKETIKILMKKEVDGELNILRQLAFLGIEARYRCLEEAKEGKGLQPMPPPREEEKKIEGPIIRAEEIEELSARVNRFSERMEEAFQRVDQQLAAMGETIRIALERRVEKSTPEVNITVFKIGDELFGVESEKVFKLFRVPESFHQKYASHPRIRLRDIEVKLVNLKEIFSLEGLGLKDQGRVLAVKENGEVKGLLVDEVIKRGSGPLKRTGGSEEYFLGTVQSSFEGHPAEIPILDLKKL